MRRVGPMLAALVAASALALPVGQAPVVEAAPSDVIAVVIEGTGNGHGRGMSQWGAYGWAVDQGWNWVQILDHYYGGTVMGDVDVNSRISVRLQAMDNQASVAVVSYGAGGVRFNGTSYPAYLSFRAVRTAGGFNVFGSPTINCTAGDNPPGDVWLGNVAAVSFTTATGETSGSNALDSIGLCQPNGSVVHYRGSINASIPDGVRVVNELRTEDYLRGVVPREVAASWADAGSGRGAEAVRAQAVAARSYALTQNRYSYARTCDSTACQAYGGAATRPTVGEPARLREDYRTDQAIGATAGKVRKWPSTGAIVSTEFSASNGPRTAGGAFPVVEDVLGDATRFNPNHRWTRVLDADTLAERYGLGTITSASMVEAASSSYRQYDGIWFNDLVLTGSNGNTFRQQAWDFRGANGLPSPGFTVRVVTRNDTNTSMAFIGDSVGVGISGAATAPFRIVTDGTFNATTFDSTESRCTNRVCSGKSSGVQAAAAVPANLDLVVVELGYNDNPSLTAADIDAMMNALNARGTRRVLWVNMAEIRVGPGGSSYYQQSNAALNAARSRWPSLGVADWNQASSGPERPRWFANDGVHLTTTGNAEFSLWLRETVAGGGGFSRRFAPNQKLELQVVGESVTGTDGIVRSVPAGASAVALNVTAVDPSTGGYMTVWPCEVARPEASNVNFAGGAVVANGVVAPVGAGGKVCIYSNAASDLLIDIAGWFAGSAFVGATPQRFVDTRNAIGGPNARIEAGAVLRVPVAGASVTRTDGAATTIPTDATAVAINVTAETPFAQGYFTVWPCGTPQPVASNVNFLAGTVVANGVVAPIGADGGVCIYTNQNTDILVDVLGWFGAGGGQTPFVGAVPQRLVDTRNAIGGPTGRIVPDAPKAVPVRGVVLNVNGVEQAVPASATAVALNVTMAEAGAAGYATVWPCGTTRPEASNVNFADGGTVANGVVAPIGPDGSVCVFSSVDAHLIVDIAGWFAGGNPASFTGNVPRRLVDTRNAIGPVPS